MCSFSEIGILKHFIHDDRRDPAQPMPTGSPRAMQACLHYSFSHAGRHPSFAPNHITYLTLP